MSFHRLIHNVLDDTLSTSLWRFGPELVVCATIVAMLLLRMVDRRGKTNAFYLMVIGTGAALYLAAPWHYLVRGVIVEPVEIFTGALIFDTFAVYMRGLLLFFALLFATFTQTSGIPEREDGTEFYVLILGATLGMCLMVSANHMLIVFLGIEMASVPSYVLAGMLKLRRQSSEAALKYAVFGAATAGVMLYGISLLVGCLGSAHLPTMAVQLADMLQSGQFADRYPVLMLGGLMLMVGVAFKLSAVPFHFWAPDVFEGATAEVAAFLSIASKVAALGLLVRLGLGFGYIPQSVPLPDQQRATAVARVADADIRTVATDGASAGLTEEDVRLALQGRQLDLQRWRWGRQLTVALEPVRKYIVGLIALLAAVTCTFGNLAAYGQTNIKRLLAYSTIAHAGYMMMPVAAAVAVVGSDPRQARLAVASMAFYAGIYLFMNLGAFAAVAFLRNEIGSERIADYAGLVRRSPGLTVCLAIVMFSLLGMPPLAGFAAKFTIFASVYNSATAPWHAPLLALLCVGVLNTVLSLFYYLRVVKVMTLEPESEERPTAVIPLSSTPGAYCLILTAPIVILGLSWNGLFDWAEEAARTLLF